MLATELDRLGAELEADQLAREAERRGARPAWPELARTIRRMGGIDTLSDISPAGVPGGLWRRPGGRGVPYDELPLMLSAAGWPELADRTGDQVLEALWQAWEGWNAHQVAHSRPAAAAPAHVVDVDPLPEPDLADREAYAVAEAFGAVGEPDPEPATVAPILELWYGRRQPAAASREAARPAAAARPRLKPTGFGPRDSELRGKVRAAAAAGRVTRAQRREYDLVTLVEDLARDDADRDQLLEQLAEERDRPRQRRQSRPARPAAARPAAAPRPRAVRRRRPARAARALFLAGMAAAAITALALVLLLAAAVAGAAVPVAWLASAFTLPAALAGVLGAWPMRPARSTNTTNHTERPVAPARRAA